MEFSIKGSFSKCDQTHLLKKSLLENFIFCAVLFSFYVAVINIIRIVVIFICFQIWYAHPVHKASMSLFTAGIILT